LANIRKKKANIVSPVATTRDISRGKIGFETNGTSVSALLII